MYPASQTRSSSSIVSLSLGNTHSLLNSSLSSPSSALKKRASSSPFVSTTRTPSQKLSLYPSRTPNYDDLLNTPDGFSFRSPLNPRRRKNSVGNKNSFAEKKSSRLPLLPYGSHQRVSAHTRLWYRTRKKTDKRSLSPGAHPRWGVSSLQGEREDRSFLNLSEKVLQSSQNANEDFFDQQSTDALSSEGESTPQKAGEAEGEEFSERPRFTDGRKKAVEHALRESLGSSDTFGHDEGASSDRLKHILIREVLKEKEQKKTRRDTRNLPNEGGKEKPATSPLAVQSMRPVGASVPEEERHFVGRGKTKTHAHSRFVPSKRYLDGKPHSSLS